MVKHGEPFRGSGIEESLDCCGGCETIVTRTFGRVFLEMSLLLLLHKNLVAEGQFRDVDEIDDRYGSDGHFNRQHLRRSSQGFQRNLRARTRQPAQTRRRGYSKHP